MRVDEPMNRRWVEVLADLMARLNQAEQGDVSPLVPFMRVDLTELWMRGLEEEALRATAGECAGIDQADWLVVVGYHYKHCEHKRQRLGWPRRRCLMLSKQADLERLMAGIRFTDRTRFCDAGAEAYLRARFPLAFLERVAMGRKDDRP